MSSPLDELRAITARNVAAGGAIVAEDDVARWLRDEERLAAGADYCRCGAHVVGTPCYAGDDLERCS